MSLTVHDILIDADLFRRAYPGWPSVAPAPGPLDGPFPSSLQLTSYADDEPGFAIVSRLAGPGAADWALARLGDRPQKALELSAARAEAAS